jgi:hypothetical protein
MQLGIEVIPLPVLVRPQELCAWAQGSVDALRNFLLHCKFNFRYLRATAIFFKNIVYKQLIINTYSRGALFNISSCIAYKMGYTGPSSETTHDQERQNDYLTL